MTGEGSLPSPDSHRWLSRGTPNLAPWSLKSKAAISTTFRRASQWGAEPPGSEVSREQRSTAA